MSGCINIFRSPEDYGKNAPMQIVITDVLGIETNKTVDNGKSKDIELDDGKYTVYVKHNMKSEIQEVEITSGCTINMKATIIPNSTILLERI